MRLALAQMNSVVGDLDGNRDRIARADRRGARRRRRPRRCFPELAVTGYPPEDLLLRPGFVRAARRTVEESPPRARHRRARRRPAPRHRSLQRLLRPRRRRDPRRLPQALPAELRRLRRGPLLRPRRRPLLLRFGETIVGPTICEDIWQPGPPATDLALAGAQLVANISASPFHVGKDREREEMLRVRARDNSCFIALCNAVGGAGRADLRRSLARARRRGRAHRAGAGVRGGAARRRRRPGRGGRAAPAGRAPPRARARPRRAPRRRRCSSSTRRARRRTPADAAPAPLLDDLEQMRRALELGPARLRRGRTASATS